MRNIEQLRSTCHSSQRNLFPIVRISSIVSTLRGDLRSFEILFEFESDDYYSIRFESDGLVRNFQLSRTCRRTTNHAYCSTKKNVNRCAVVIKIYFMIMILVADLQYRQKTEHTSMHWCPRCPDIPSFRPCGVHLYVDTPINF